MHKSVAIDGPSGAGKSTIARALAQALGFLYIDTGALYRALGLMALREGVSPIDAGVVEAMLTRADVALRHENGRQKVLLNGEDISEEIRDHAVSGYASSISALPVVRAFLLERQRAFARESDVIMDGRDIGTVVLPDADVKIFLTALPEDRAWRRYEELLARGQDVQYEDILRDVLARDQNDSTRSAAPLVPAHDAIPVDTTGNTWEKSFAIISDLVREKLAECSIKSST